MTDDKQNNWPGLAILVFVSALLSGINWLYIADPTGDAGMWLHQATRIAHGEWPYRDFALVYPPLSLSLVAAAFKVFGAKYYVANALVDLLSFLIVICFWRVARRLMTPKLALALTVAFAYGMTTTHVGILFYLGVHTPALLTGGLGGLIALGAALDMVEKGIELRSAARFVFGSLLAILSKPEYWAGIAVLLLAIHFLMDRQRRQYLRWIVLAIASVVPSLCVYASIARVVTLQRLWWGLTGYGLAMAGCPYWPTGLGVTLHVAALGRGLVIICLLLFLEWRSKPKTKILNWSGWIVIGLLLAALPLILPGVDGSGWTLKELAYWLTDPRTWLLGVVSCAAYILITSRRPDGQRPLDERLLLVVLAELMALSIRGWFTGPIGTAPEIAGCAWSAAFLAAPGLASIGRRRLVAATPETQPRFEWALSMVLVAYAVAGISASMIPSSARRSPVMQTRAGPVRPGNMVPEFREAYAYVSQRLPAEAEVLELPFFGGVAFAANLRSPLFSTELKLFKPQQSLLDSEVAKYRAHPAQLAVLTTGENGRLAQGNAAGCTFPRLVFWPILDTHPGFVFPIVPAIDRDYREARRFGAIEILELKVP